MPLSIITPTNYDNIKNHKFEVIFKIFFIEVRPTLYKARIYVISDKNFIPILTSPKSKNPFSIYKESTTP